MSVLYYHLCYLLIFFILEPPLFIVTPPNNVSVRYNNAITLNCSSGGVPLPNITWFKDGIVIPTDQYTSSDQSDTLITMLTVVGSLTSHGYYTCQAVNDLVERRVINTTVNVTVFGKYVVISKLSLIIFILYLEPLSYVGSANNVTLNQSDTFTVNCSFYGFPLPVISWFFLNNFTYLNNNSRVSITTSSEEITVTSTLTVRNVDKSTDEGVYHCIGSSSYTVYISLCIG